MNKFFRFGVYYVRLLAAWVFLHVFKRTLLKKSIWLIREKRDEARDNGYHFFKYLRQNHPEIEAFYAITPNAPDRSKIVQYGNLIDADSWKHCLYFLAAEYSIGSQPYGAFPFRFGASEMNYIQKLCNPKQKVVFLQHGVIKDKLPEANFLYDLCNIDYFVCSAPREYEFVKETYGYPDGTIGCIGLARFDNLITPHTEENIILVMPTWRTWLSCCSSEPTQAEKQRFIESDYYKAYASLLSDDKLIDLLRLQKYKLVFYMHYKLQPYAELFYSFANDVIVVADKGHYDVQDLLMKSKLMVTDFSSVHFDFAYLNKPVIYFQFDEEKFRQSHFAKGYYSYEDDGFGPCFTNYELFKRHLCETLAHNCIQPKEYENRVKEFFAPQDGKNCERTFEAISSLKK